jgi:hypothetical protein
VWGYRITAAARPAVLALAACALLALAVPAGAATLTIGPRSGGFYAATSTSSPGGGAYEDVALSTSAGQLVCGSAWLRTQFPATGAAGTFALWLIGGAHSDGGSTPYAGLSTLTNWTQAQACVEATTSHSALRIQFYPAPGSPTVNMDDVDVHESLAVNGGFEQGGSGWGIYPGTSSNFSVYAGTASRPAHSGGFFAATNTASAGGGIYQDDALTTTAGETVCASAWVRTEGTSPGASGSFALWLMGGSTPSDHGGAGYSGLSTNWTQLHTCVEATTNRSTLRLQFYPDIGSPTVEIDDVDAHISLAGNGGFETGGADWSPYPGTSSNFSVYTGSASAPPHSGSAYGASNTASPGGGIYQDVPLTAAAGETICGSAWVRTEGAATGASGSFALWLMGGGAASDQGAAQYSGLPNGVWTQISTCVEATRARSALRLQFYPAIGSPTVEMDDVDVEMSLAANGGFEYGSGPWSSYPNTQSSFGVYPATTVTIAPPPPPVVTTPQPTTLPLPRSRRALRVRVALSWTWRYGITRLNTVRFGRHPGRLTVTILCRGHGCPRPLRLTASKSAELRRLLRRLHGRRYRAGDRLFITLTAPGYRPERAELTIRYGRLPLARLLASAPPRKHGHRHRHRKRKRTR